jgi:hypothetical protein
VREYVVQPGDSPASIAAKDEHAGCPKCAKDLIDANRHKASVTYPNGFRTFRELRAGERLLLPDSWFNGELDRRPQAYFNSLPRHDGVTPGVGRSQSVIDVIGAGQAVAEAVAADPDYCVSVGKVGSAVNVAVHEFKVAWNTNTPNNPVPIGTGDLEPATSQALVTVLGDKAPAACGAQPLQQEKRLSTGAVVGIGLAAVAIVGGVTYVVTRNPKRGRRR